MLTTRKGGWDMKRIAMLVATLVALVMLAPPALAYHGQELVLTKTLDQSGPVNVGDAVSFTITLTNTARSTAFSGLEVYDELPEGFEILSYGIEGGTGSECMPQNNTLRCAIPGNLDPGETVTIRVGTRATEPGTFVNTASTNCAALESGTGCEVYGG